MKSIFRWLIKVKFIILNKHFMKLHLLYAYYIFITNTFPLFYNQGTILEIINILSPNLKSFFIHKKYY